MKKHDKRIASRLPSNVRTKMQQLINDGRFKNMSQVIRAALENFLELR